jgi:Domain of unknown function (DUF6398)
MSVKSDSVPQQMRPIYDAIVAFTDSVCHEYLDEEYAELARKMAAALARKRPSPLASGRADGWACGILYALGRTNFLFDKSQTPHMRADELCKACGVSQSSASAKAAVINQALKVGPLNLDWLLPSRLDDYPLAWLLSVNGLIIDVRDAPRFIQEEAFRKGLIPYIPDDGPPEKK